MIKLNAVLGLFSKNKNAVTTIEKEVVKAAETHIPIASRNCLNAGDTVAFGLKSAPKDFASQWVEANKNLSILKQANMPEDIIKAYQETRVPTIKYLGESKLSTNQQKFSKHMQEVAVQKKLDENLAIAKKQLAKAEQRAKDLANAKDGYIKSYLDAQYDMKFSKLTELYPELGTPSGIMGFLKKESVNRNVTQRNELLDEMVKALKSNNDEVVEKEFVDMLKEDIAAYSKKIQTNTSERLDFKTKFRLQEDIKALAEASKDKAAFAKELEETLSLTTNSEVRSSYMTALGEYGKKNPSDLSFIDVINKSIKDTLGNDKYSKISGYNALSSYDGQYNSLKNMFTETYNNDILHSLLRSAKTDAQKQDLAKHILNEIEGLRKMLNTMRELIRSTDLDSQLSWVKSTVIRPVIDKGYYKNTNMEQLLISALSK